MDENKKGNRVIGVSSDSGDIKFSEGEPGRIFFRLKEKYLPGDISIPSSVTGELVMMKEDAEIIKTTIEGDSEAEVVERLTDYLSNEVFHSDVLAALKKRHKML